MERLQSQLADVHYNPLHDCKESPPCHSVSLESFKSSKVKNCQALLNVPSHNPPKYVWIHLDTSMSTIVHRPLETSQAPRPHRLEWRFPEPAKETTRRCDPEQVLAYSTQAAQQACLVRTQQAKSGQKQTKKHNKTIKNLIL